MDEVDRIIIHSLNDIGCSIDDGVTGLGQFSTELVVEASVRCLQVIRPNLNIPLTLPANMAARFNIAASIANACKEIGYSGDVGYQTFLYSNVSDVRRVFMFLIEKLPKESEKTEFEPDDPLSRLKADVGRVLKEQLSKCKRPCVAPNQPFVSVPLETGVCLPGLRNKDFTPQDWRDYCINRLPFLTDQVGAKLVLPSIIALNERGGEPGSHTGVPPPADVPKGDESTQSSTGVPVPAPRVPRPRPTPPARNNTWLALRQNILYATEPVETPVEEIKPNDATPSEGEGTSNGGTDGNGECSAEEIREREIERVKASIEELQSTVQAITSQIAKVKDAKEDALLSMKECTKEAEVRKKALALVAGGREEGEANRRKLEEAVERRASGIVSLAAHWDKRRRPLLEKYRQARRTSAKRANESKKQMDTVREMQEKLDSLNRQIALKTSIRSKLEEEYDKLPKNVNRSVYTRRILEIIGNIKKQGEEIDKVLRDTKELQKEINLVTGRLERSFTVTDEVIFRDAKRDECLRRAYKLLITLHSDCSDLVAMLQETGNIVRETRDLQDQIDVESAKNVGANLERISADLDQMRAENATFLAQLKQLRPT